MRVMYRQFLCIMALLAALTCGAQVTMTIQVPPSGVLLKKQLWNLALVYTGSTPLGVKISLTISSASGDQQLITAVTPLFTLNRGAKQIQAADVAPIQYQYLSPSVTDRDPDGFLPVGSYQACYTVQVGDEVGTPLAEDCLSFEVAPLSPPELNTPADEDTLITTLPQFTWVPPSPVNLFSNLAYRFNLVEVQPGQTANDALEQNIPVYSYQNCTDIFINYPSSAMALDTGRQYAWQVTAENNMQPAAQSEVWTFRVKGFGPPANTFAGNYIILKNNAEKAGVYDADGGTVGIKYYSFDKPRQALVRFFGAGQKLVAEMPANLVYGDNYIIYNMGSGFQKGQLYFIELADLHNNKYTAAFRVR